MTFRLPRGGIVGVIGPNGAGKIDPLADPHRAGEAGRRDAARSGETVKVALRRPVARRARSGQDASGRRSPGAPRRSSSGSAKVASRAYVAAFNFKGADQQKRVGELSGGERNRVHLAKLLKERREPHPSRRADERPRRRYAPFAGRGAARLRGLRGGRVATTGGSSTGSPRTSSPSRATARSSGSRGITRSTKRTRKSGWASTPTSRTGSVTRSLRGNNPAMPIPALA